MVPTVLAVVGGGPGGGGVRLDVTPTPVASGSSRIGLRPAADPEQPRGRTGGVLRLQGHQGDQPGLSPPRSVERREIDRSDRPQRHQRPARRCRHSRHRQCHGSGPRHDLGRTTRTVTDLNSLLPANAAYPLRRARHQRRRGHRWRSRARQHPGRLPADHRLGRDDHARPARPWSAGLHARHRGEQYVATPLQNVTPPRHSRSPRRQGDAEVGPRSSDGRDARCGASAIFTYVSRATNKGAIVFSGTYVRRVPRDRSWPRALRVGTSPRSSAPSGDGGDVPANGDGAAITISTCWIGFDLRRTTAAPSSTTTTSPCPSSARQPPAPRERLSLGGTSRR